MNKIYNFIKRNYDHSITSRFLNVLPGGALERYRLAFSPKRKIRDNDLVAMASHQLRVPLTVAKGNVEMLLDESLGKINREQRETLNMIFEANGRMICLVRDMLDITKIERGELEIKLRKNENLLVTKLTRASK